MTAFSSPLFRSRRQKGIALLAVLICMAVLTLLTVAYFDAVRRTSSGSAVKASSEDAARTGESALNLALSQIEAATKVGIETAWTSQPGAIRTFSNDTGEPISVFKLYSAPLDEMVVSGSNFAVNSEWAPKTWTEQPGVWTDLNAPARGIYPIVSPEALEPPAGGTYTGSRIEGFSVDTSADPVVASGTSDPLPMPVRWIYQLKDGTLVTPTGGDAAKTNIPGATRKNPPVARFAFWTDDDTCKLNINTASETAYWETPRYGTPTDAYFQGRSPTNREFQRYPGHPSSTSLRPALWSYLGLSSPDVSVEPVINLAREGTWLTLNTSRVTATLSTSATNYIHGIFGKDASAGGYWHGLAPRTVWGGSQQGMAESMDPVSWGALYSLPLYTSVDELAFGRPEPADAVAGGLRPRTSVDPSHLDELRFFLTTSSRAPEVTLSNQPRVSIWPVDDPTKVNPSNDYFPKVADSRSPVDNLMTFCATIGTKPFYFTRNDPEDPAGDWTTRNGQLYDYLFQSLSRNSPLRLPGITGNGSFVSKYTAPVVQEQLTLIYDYLRAGVNTIDTSGRNADGTIAENKNRYKYSFAKPANSVGSALDRPRMGSGQVFPFEHPNGTKGAGRYPTLQQAALMFIATAADQPPVMIDPVTRKPLKDGSGNNIVNLMHPYKDKTFAPGSRYPTIGGKTHAGLPFLSDPDPATDKYDQPNPAYSGPGMNPYETQMQTMLILRPVVNLVGVPAVSTSFKIRVEGLTGLSANGLPLFSKDKFEFPVDNRNYNINAAVGGYAVPFDFMYLAAKASQTGDYKDNAVIGDSVVVGGYDSASTEKQKTDFAFASSGPITITFLSTADKEIQKFNIEFPDASFPIPKLPSFIPAEYAGYAIPPATELFPARLLKFTDGNTNGRLIRKTITTKDGNLVASNAGDGSWIFSEMAESGFYGAQTADTVRAMEIDGGDTRITGALKTVPTSLFKPNKYYFRTDIRPAHSLGGLRGVTLSPLTDLNDYSNTYVVSSPIDWSAGATQWDRRVPSPSSGYSVTYNSDGSFKKVTGSSEISTLFPAATSSVDFEDSSFLNIWKKGGDFDTGLGFNSEGPYLNKPDEGASDYFGVNSITYFGNGAGVFSVNRQIPSPVMLGSLPSRLNPTAPAKDQAWQTFVFSPNPNAGANHAALQSNPPDYSLLDLLWMPVVEPYAISEPFSTAGKVNMNYQIVPFSYLKRDTALRGVLRSVMLTAVPDKDINKYKGANASSRLGDGNPSGPFDTEMANSGQWGFRYPVHPGETLKQFDKKFADGGVFLSESEICSLWLYPATQPTASDAEATKTPLVNYDANAANIKSWWYDDAGNNRKALTADNVRERPYALLYPRLTTRSNTYTVHVRAQALAPSVTQDGVYAEKAGTVLAEWRGNHTVERYIDPSDSNLNTVDFTASGAAKTLDSFYKMRVLNTTRFMP